MNGLKLLVLASALSVCACDGLLAMTGRTYEWRNPPRGARSVVFVDNEEAGVPEGEMRPLSGAVITVYHATDYSEEAVAGGEMWEDRAKTNSEGGFEIHVVSNPYGEFRNLVTVSCEGFESARALFRHRSPETHHLRAYLVRRAGRDEK